MDDQVCHVSDQISSEANVEKHVQHVKDLLPCIYSMQVTIANSGEGDNRPIHGIRVSQPDALVLEIVDLGSNPCIFW